ncbi:RNA methyltransferase [Aurantimonas sp. VKM B-3413]|uniref:TrmH family RNA methyltransferase n=1 Tax=Aurantimonas sp. VKM B-3413 TaxID=2779401 RepID=UPI001E5F10F3|nr:RNA methyltransferase [Aurantimonas sp. VKM B-3413]MCB8839010.1 RNA methyltransferase [Aurantimonas sp. VKM B-3413]
MSERPNIIDIEDPDDPRVEDFRDVRERDLVRRGGFIAEGAVVLDHLIGSARFGPTALLILESRLAGLGSRLARLPADVPIYVTGREVFDRIAGFPVNRGVLAHAEDRGGGSDASQMLAAARARGRPVVVLIGLSNHDNVGAIFRNAAAFGAGAVLLDATSCHPLYRKALRVSVGTVLTVPWRYGGASEDIAEMVEAAGFRPIALAPGGDTGLAAVAEGGPAALFLGSEGDGLPPGLMGRMRTVRIAMEPALDSLNVATSAAIVLHALYSAA